jgi:glycosyltransferase involved in cell wall biosynthesis
VRRVLIVAYYFPPAGGIGSLRLSGFAKHLPEFGWEPLVVAPRDPVYHRDPDLAVDEHLVVRTGAIELSRAGKRALHTGGNDTAAADVSGIRMQLRDAARGALYFPDAQIGWFPFALRAARAALQQMPVDAIFSSSFPVTAHLIARRLHRMTAAPWIAEFRDPWALTLPERSVKRRRAASLERRLMGEATTALTVSPSWAQLFEQTWDRPVGVLPNGYETAHPKGEPVTGDVPVIGYLGTYYPASQDLSAAFEALKTVPGPVQVRLIGAASVDFRKQLALAGFADRLEVTGFLPQRAALEQLASCSALLLAGPREASGLSRGHVVAKVWEYLATPLPIVYVGDPSSDVSELLRGYAGCSVHAPDDVAGISRFLRSSLGQHYERVITGASRRARTAQLAEILARACYS